MKRQGFGGGFATPAKPILLDPGTTDPRVRSFTNAIPDPDLVAQYGFDAVQMIGVAGMVPPPEDLDRVALFAPPPISGEWSVFTWPAGPMAASKAQVGQTAQSVDDARDATWADIQNAGTAIGRPDLNALAVKSSLAWWRQAYALGPLPEDEQGVDEPGSVSYGWSPGGYAFDPDYYRRIYFWGFGKDGKLYQHMQLQKGIDPARGWIIFNKWGEDLTFVWNGSQWTAGWDFGDWFTQNKVSIVAGLQLAVTAAFAMVPVANAAIGIIASTVFGITSYGLSAGLTAAMASALTAQQFFISGMLAIAKGDINAAFSAFTQMAKNLSNVPIPSSGATVPPELQALVSNPAVKSLAKVVEATGGSGDINVIVQKSAELAKAGVIKFGQQELAQARTLVPPSLQPWFDMAAQKGAMALGDRVNALGSAAWYAGGVYDFGTAMGTLANPESAGVHATRQVYFDPWLLATGAVKPVGNPFGGADPRAPLNALVAQLKQRYGI